MEGKTTDSLTEAKKIAGELPAMVMQLNRIRFWVGFRVGMIWGAGMVGFIAVAVCNW